MAELRSIKVGDWILPKQGRSWMGKVTKVENLDSYDVIHAEPYKCPDDMHCCRGGKLKKVFNNNLIKVDDPDKYKFVLYKYGDQGTFDYVSGFHTEEELEEMNRSRWAIRNHAEFFISEKLPVYE